MASSIPLSFNHPLLHRTHRPSFTTITTIFPIFKPPTHSHSKSHVCFSISSSNSSNHEREEARWLREEQRWLREEQRWFREEQRWGADRESLLREISSLKLRIGELERQNSNSGPSVSDTVSNIAGLLDLGKKLNRIAESGSSAVPLVIDAAESGEVEEEEEVKVVKEVVRVSERKEKMEVTKRQTLRNGSEGDDVRILQEALLNLGFYSGEEDMEFCCFSSGTERAVKTWQSTLGVHEDGIMTEELLERLYNEQHIVRSGLAVNADPKKYDATDPEEGANGAVVASITEISEIKETVVEEEGAAEVGVSGRRVFLLGENRWEDSSRLSSGGNNKQASGGTKGKDATNKCLTCRGEGRLLCTECDGTGEPNIEPQFLEWVDEGTKCPYCEGLGYNICDLCKGEPVF